jgi:hypothetical protein
MADSTRTEEFTFHALENTSPLPLGHRMSARVRLVSATDASRNDCTCTRCITTHTAAAARAGCRRAHTGPRLHTTFPTFRNTHAAGPEPQGTPPLRPRR